MNIAEAKKNIIYLYDKYDVSKSFFSDMDEKSFFRGIKGILAELDNKKNRPYEECDIEIIRSIYGYFC